MTASGDRRVLLHLGMHKTGSTSIQAVWNGYKDERIEYAPLGLPNHSLVLQRAVLEGKAADRVYKNSDAVKRPRQQEAAVQRLEAVLGGTSRSLILSAESLFRFDAEACHRCVALLRRHVDRIDPLLYIRAPESFARSVFQERLKKGEASFELRHIIPAYKARSLNWAEALGREPSYVMFDRATLHEGDVVMDFGTRAGLDLGWARSRAHLQNRNTSLSAEAMAALYVLRHRLGAPPSHEEERVRQRRLIEVLGGFGTRRYDFGRNLMQAALDERAEDIAWIEGRLGRSFPSETVKDPVVFGSEREILEYGEAQAGALREHLRAEGIIGGKVGGSVVDLLQAVRGQVIGLKDVKREVGKRQRTLGQVLKIVMGQFSRARG
jgi:hypothetical protein